MMIKKINKNRIESLPSEAPILTSDSSIKKFYIEPNEQTKIINNKSFVEFVSETVGKSIDESLLMIKESKVSVNRNIVTDDKYELKSGDIVRCGVLGHFLQGPNNISIVK